VARSCDEFIEEEDHSLKGIIENNFPGFMKIVSPDFLSYDRIHGSAQRATFSKSPKVDILQRFTLLGSEEEYTIWMIRI